MLKYARVVAIMLCLSVAVSAQTQIATVSSTAPFKLGRAKVTPSVAVPTWPLQADQAIEAGNMPVSLSFPDGSNIILAPKAKAIVRMVDGRPVFTLQSEAAHYTLSRVDALKLMARSETVQPRALVGDIAFGSDNLPAGWWTRTNVALVAAVAGTAAVATVGLTRRNGPPVSPTQCNNGNGNGNGLPAC